mmetsp:Transcript_15583/g.26822  ORF Transcript_15583/g.26822 Transcript_15583/m.26822 type:complete len:236 (-) Transcript_15583:183-890(-)
MFSIPRRVRTRPDGATPLACSVSSRRPSASATRTYARSCTRTSSSRARRPCSPTSRSVSTRRWPTLRPWKSTRRRCMLRHRQRSASSAFSLAGRLWRRWARSSRCGYLGKSTRRWGPCRWTSDALDHCRLFPVPAARQPTDYSPVPAPPSLGKCSTRHEYLASSTNACRTRHCISVARPSFVPPTSSNLCRTCCCCTRPPCIHSKRRQEHAQHDIPFSSEIRPAHAVSLLPFASD